MTTAATPHLGRQQSVYLVGQERGGDLEILGQGDRHRDVDVVVRVPLVAFLGPDLTVPQRLRLHHLGEKKKSDNEHGKMAGG